MVSKFSTEISRRGIEDLDEARHVGALEVVGQADIHVEVGDGVAHAAALVQHLEGWRMSLMPTLLIGNWRESALLWTSAMTDLSVVPWGSWNSCGSLGGVMESEANYTIIRRIYSTIAVRQPSFSVTLCYDAGVVEAELPPAAGPSRRGR
jgi:hypothetical protein